MQTDYVLSAGELFANVRARIPRKTTLTASTTHWAVFAEGAGEFQGKISPAGVTLME